MEKVACSRDDQAHGGNMRMPRPQQLDPRPAWPAMSSAIKRTHAPIVGLVSADVGGCTRAKASRWRPFVGVEEALTVKQAEVGAAALQWLCDETYRLWAKMLALYSCRRRRMSWRLETMSLMMSRRMNRMRGRVRRSVCCSSPISDVQTDAIEWSGW